MQAQRWIAVQAVVHVTRAHVLFFVKAAGTVVLAEADAVTDGLAERHVMIKIERTSGPSRGQHVARAEGCPEKIAFVIPIAEIAAEVHRENGLDVVEREIVGTADAAAWVIAAAP